MNESHKQRTNQWPTRPGLSAVWAPYPIDCRSAAPDVNRIDLPPDIRRSVPSRIDEYLAGRYCAERALEALGAHAPSVARNPDRSPIWPNGFTGSIAHTEGYAGAVVASSSLYRSIGIDIEKVFTTDYSSYRDIFLTDIEIDCVENLSSERGSVYATVVFSMKESVFKCVYPLCGRYFDFLDVQVERLESERVTAVFRSDIGGTFTKGTVIYGEYRVENALVKTGVFLEI